MGADNQAARVIARLEQQQMAAETAKDGATMQIYKTAKRCREEADAREQKQKQKQME